MNGNPGYQRIRMEPSTQVNYVDAQNLMIMYLLVHQLECAKLGIIGGKFFGRIWKIVQITLFSKKSG
jgi:hypothetical protein